jgi:hypothetical protein
MFGFYVAFFCCILFLAYIVVSTIGRNVCNAVVTTVNTTDPQFLNTLGNLSNGTINVTVFAEVQQCLLHGTTSQILLSSVGILDVIQGAVPSIKLDVTELNAMISSCSFSVGDALLDQVFWGNHKFTLESITAIDDFANETKATWDVVNLSTCKSRAVSDKFQEIVSGSLALKDLLQLIDCYNYQQFYETVFVEDLCTDLLHHCVKMGIVSGIMVFIFVGLLMLAFWAGLRLWPDPSVDVQQTYGDGDQKFVELKEMGHQIN